MPKTRETACPECGGKEFKRERGERVCSKCGTPESEFWTSKIADLAKAFVPEKGGK